MYPCKKNEYGALVVYVLNLHKGYCAINIISHLF